LILMPLSNWDSWSSTTTGVQLLDLYRDRIVKRGLLQQPLAPRRATVHRNRIVAISPQTLLAIDATDRDVPRVTADVEIAWQVDRVFAIGEHVVQLGSEWRRANGYEVTLTVSPANSPDESLHTLSLSGDPLVDVTLRDEVLYLVQMQAGESWWDYNAGVYREGSPDRVTLSAVDLSRLPRLALLGSVTATVSYPDRRWYGWGSSARSLWINENTLGFVIGGGRSLIAPYWYDPPPYDTYKWVWVPNPDVPSVDAAAIDAGSEADVTVTQIYVGKSPGHYECVTTGTIDPPAHWFPRDVFSKTQRVFAFNVRDPARLRFTSHFDIGGDQPWDVAPPVAVDGAVFASYQHLGTLLTTQQFETFARASATDPGAFAEKGPTRTNRHFLVSVDYSDPRHPVLSSNQPNLPGCLIGVAREGSILFTTGQRYDPLSGGVDLGWEVLHASAVDGDVVHLLDQLPFTQYGKPPEIRGTTIFQFQSQPAKIWVPSNEPAPPAGDLILGDPISGVQLSLIGSPFWASNAQLTIIGAPYWNPGTYEDNPRKSTLTTWELGANGKFARLDEVELAHESTFHFVGKLGVAYQRANQPRLLDLSEPSALRILGFLGFEGAPSLNYEFADGAADRGLWIPTGQYGLEAFIFSP
ncbi:MAG TPA: hypothetical protein VFD27_14895, partial [Chthoniobacteraceae bacterium]|nr:hypothetical protein [Chthoniobacteraceae bacterium]